MSKLKSDRSIFWFRQDLRLENNPALLAASKCGEIIPVFILDEVNNRNQVLGAASKLWLHNPLKALNIQLGGKLRFMSGNPKVLLPELAEKNNVTNVFPIAPVAPTITTFKSLSCFPNRLVTCNTD